VAVKGPATLLLVYDAESPACRGMVDWVQARDSVGLVVAFPFQNAELVRIAPELAGLAFQGEIHGLDTRTREVHQGTAVVPALLRRLPGWRWLAPWAGLPFLTQVMLRYLLRPR
jgi:predicted DCC family thiol-disulfide oxidoreductase YuxK